MDFERIEEMTNEELKEKLTAAYYREKHKHMRNCWDWDDSGLDDEHPGARDRFFHDVECFVRSIEAHGYVIMPVEATEAMCKASYHGTSRESLYKAMVEAGKVTL